MVILKRLIRNYACLYPDESAPPKMLEYMKNSDCFSNDNYRGHFTGSAWVISPNKEQILMKEGCLTFPFLFLNISRPRIIEVEYEDVDGKVIKEDLNQIDRFIKCKPS